MTSFYDDLFEALVDSEPGSISLSRGVPAGSSRLEAVLTMPDLSSSRKKVRVALDAGGLDTPIDRGAVERFADAAASLGLRRAVMLSGRGATLEAHALATARGVDMLFVREHPKGLKSRPFARIYPIVNEQVFEPDPAGAKLRQSQWQRVHRASEEKPAAVKVVSASGAELATFRDLVRALPLDRPEALIGKGFSGKRPAEHAYVYPGATLSVKGLPPIPIRGVSFNYWIEVWPMDAKTRGAAFADLLLDALFG